MASKSAKQLALQRSRQAAIASNTLPEWYEARRAEQALERAEAAPMATPPQSAPVTPPYTPPAPFKSPERAAWEAAYASEQGPVGGSWPEDATGYSRFMVWRLPVHIPTHPGTLRNFRRFS